MVVCFHPPQPEADKSLQYPSQTTENWLVFRRPGWHRGCSKRGRRAASAARPAAPVFRWSIRPTINCLPGCRESRETLPAPPCTFRFYKVLRGSTGSTRFVQRREPEERTPQNPVEPRRTCQNPIFRGSSSVPVRRGSLQAGGDGAVRMRRSPRRRRGESRRRCTPTPGTRRLPQSIRER